MTFSEAINTIDRLKPNSYSEKDKVRWLIKLEELIEKTVLGSREYSVYDYENIPLDTELIADSAYDEMYVAWLESKIDYYNNEYQRYNNSITHFNDLFDAYTTWYNRNSDHKQTQFKYF